MERSSEGPAAANIPPMLTAATLSIGFAAPGSQQGLARVGWWESGDKVATPNGWWPKECVHEVPSGTSIKRHHADGGVQYRFPNGSTAHRARRYPL